MFSNLSDALPHAQGGAIRILAVSGSHRSPQLPDVPTLQESGINVSNTTTCGVYGPAGLPAAVVQKLGDAALQAVRAPDARERLGKYVFDTAPSTGQELVALMADESRLFARLVKVSGYVPESS